MRLTLEKNPDAIRRYRHLTPGRAWWTRRCRAHCPGTSRSCTREREHRGPHITHGWFGRILAVWDEDVGRTIPRSPVRAPRKAPARGSRIGLKIRRPDGLLPAAFRRLRSFIAGPEELIFLVLFVAFVAFAIQVVVSILQ